MSNEELIAMVHAGINTSIAIVAKLNVPEARDAISWRLRKLERDKQLSEVDRVRGRGSPLVVYGKYRKPKPDKLDGLRNFRASDYFPVRAA